VTRYGLALLTGLTRLQQLTIQACRLTSDAELEKFGQLQGIQKAVASREPEQPGMAYTYVWISGEVWHGGADCEESYDYDDSDDQQ
jgi:hypothetical protein